MFGNPRRYAFRENSFFVYPFMVGVEELASIEGENHALFVFLQMEVHF